MRTGGYLVIEVPFKHALTVGIRLAVAALAATAPDLAAQLLDRICVDCLVDIGGLTSAAVYRFVIISCATYSCTSLQSSSGYPVHSDKSNCVTDASTPTSISAVCLSTS